MNLVNSLGYVVVSAEDLAPWELFAEECLGLQKATLGGKFERETLHLRSDERSWRLAVELGPNGGLVALGFEVPGRAALELLRTRLEQAGHPVRVMPELAGQRHVTALMTANDPSGVPLEFFYGGKTDRDAFVSPRGAHFVTGVQGFGHAVISVADADETYRFYVDLLGFRDSDVIALGPIKLSFLSPSPRHHSLAYSEAPGGTGGELNHIMLEVDTLDAVGRALDRCIDRKIPIEAMLGKHTNDHIISFYCESPSGLHVEYGWSGRQVDDSTHVTGFYDSASYWGHRRPDGTDPEMELRRMVETQE
jgi:3,4-dihydroxy-9,10-secoandrosta-1,3,5(10)-triene-9,17-dione 4,5-dioxygenase